MAGRKRRGNSRGRGDRFERPRRTRDPRGHGRGRRRGGYVAISNGDGDLSLDVMNFRMSNLSRNP